MNIFCFVEADRRFRRGDIAQLARALAWHARGPGFESPYLHHIIPALAGFLLL